MHTIIALRLQRVKPLEEAAMKASVGPPVWEACAHAAILSGAAHPAVGEGLRRRCLTVRPRSLHGSTMTQEDTSRRPDDKPLRHSRQAEHSLR
jgi:hypothetical protein